MGPLTTGDENMSDSSGRRRFDALRIIWAVASKDIVDAIKNRTTLSIVITVLGLIVFYQLLPGLENQNVAPTLAVYDAGGSRLLSALRQQSEIELVELPSQAQMERYVANCDSVALGVVLPAGLDQALAAGGPVQLDGYVIHWASRAAADEARAFFEGQLGELAGSPGQVTIESHTVYTQADSRGKALLVSLMMVMVVLGVGILLTPSLLISEKQSRTLDVLLVSPATAGQVVAGKALAGLFYSLAGAGVVLALNTSIVIHWGLAVMAVVCGSLCAVALGLLLGSLLRMRQQMQIWAFVLYIPLLLPVFLAVEPGLAPPAVQSALGFVPTVALARAIRVSFSAQASLGLWGPALAIVLVWTGSLLAAVSWAVRRSDR